MNFCGTACRVVLAPVLTRSFRLRAMAAQRFFFVGVRCVETLSRVVLGEGGLSVVLQKMALQPRTMTLKLQRSRCRLAKMCGHAAFPFALIDSASLLSIRSQHLTYIRL